MTQLLDSFKQRFGNEYVHEHIPPNDKNIGIILIQPVHDRKVTLMCTNGLSNHTLKVNDKHKELKHIELFIALPSYWDHTDSNNPNFNWVNEWLLKLSNYVIEKNTFFAHGHTLATGNPPKSLSPMMKQTHLLVLHPIAFREQMSALKIEQKTIHFLAITPIFSDEFDYKVSRGTESLIKKMKSKGCTEILDDYRTSTVRKKYILF